MSTGLSVAAILISLVALWLTWRARRDAQVEREVGRRPRVAIREPDQVLYGQEDGKCTLTVTYRNLGRGTAHVTGVGLVCQTIESAGDVYGPKIVGVDADISAQFQIPVPVAEFVAAVIANGAHIEITYTADPPTGDLTARSKLTARSSVVFIESPPTFLPD